MTIGSSTTSSTTTSPTATTTTAPGLKLRGALAVPPIVVEGEAATVAISALVRGAGGTLHVGVVDANAPDVELGVLRDDGTGADDAADDGVYAGSVDLEAPSPPGVSLQVIASDGSGSRVADVVIRVAAIPDLGTDSETNQAINATYQAAVHARAVLQAIKSGTSSDLAELGTSLGSLGALFTTLTRDLPRPLAAGTSLPNVTPGALPIIGSEFIEPAQDALSCDRLLNSLPYADPQEPDPLPPDDARLLEFENQVLAASSNQCDGLVQADFNKFPEGRALFFCARNVVALGTPLPGVAGCDGAIAQQLTGAGVKVYLGQFEDMVKDGIGELFDVGSMTMSAIEGGVNTFLGWFADQEGQTHPIIGSSSPGETFDAPAGAYDLIVSVGGDKPLTTVGGTVAPATSTIVQFVPGTTITVGPAMPIGCGQTLHGDLGTAGQINYYSFDGTAGEAVSVAATATTGFLCPRATVLDHSGNPLGFSAPCGDPSPSLVLPKNATYYIAVSGDEFAGTGSYNVSLQFTTGRCTMSALVCGVVSDGVLGTPAQVDAYTFAASDGDVVALVAATPTESPGCTKARLFDAAGKPRGESLCNDKLDTALLSAGQYTVLVSDSALANTENYGVAVQFVRPARCATSLACGQGTPPRAITTPAQMDAYSLEGTAGDFVSLAVDQTNGLGCLESSLYDPLGMDLGFTGCVIAGGFPLDTSGPYTILVSGETFQQTGTYNLSVDCLPPD